MKISIVTVTYNCASVVADCLASIASQSHVDIEHIVVDGASTDGTLDILIANRSSFFHLVSEPDTGIYDAMNKGIRIATGDVIGFLNADDFYAHANVLQNVAQCFEKDPKLDACYSDLVYVDQYDASRIVRYWESSSFRRGSFSRGWCPPHPTFFARRSTYENCGIFDLSYKIAADVELMMRFLEVDLIRVAYVHDVWVKMRLGGTTNKSWRNVWTQNLEVLSAFRKYGIPMNPISFFLHKLWSRSVQFVRGHTQ